MNNRTILALTGNWYFTEHRPLNIQRSGWSLPVFAHAASQELARQAAGCRFGAAVDGGAGEAVLAAGIFGTHRDRSVQTTVIGIAEGGTSLGEGVAVVASPAPTGNRGRLC